jgi:hypothetical protein
MNYLAVVVAAAIAFVLGWLWYSPSLFGKQWMAAMGYTEKKLAKQKSQDMRATMGLAALANLVMMAILAIFVEGLAIASVARAILLAVWVWLGFVATTHINGVIFEQRSPVTYWIFVSYQLVSLVLGSIVLTIWP